MAITVEATYENGSLKLSEPLPLKEHEKVRVTVESRPDDATGNHVPSKPERLGLSAVEKIIARAEALPAEAVATWPTDGASQHDHYIYGTPKRTDLRDKPE